MNRRSGCLLALSLLVPALSLTSCMDRVQELYGEDEYLRGPLVDYYFTGRDDFEGKEVRANDVLPPVIGEDGYALGDMDKAAHGRPSPRDFFPEWFSWLPEGGTISAYHAEAHSMEQSYLGKDFGRTASLSAKDPSFADGIASRIYDGQLSCHSYHSKAFLNLDQDGMALMFPHAIEDPGDGILISLRGGSDVGGARDVSLSINLTLYLDLGEGIFFAETIVLEDVLLHTNDGGENVSFLAVPMDLFDTKGPLAGFGLSYEYREDPLSSEYEISAKAEEKTEGHFGLLLYELTLPGWTLGIS